MKRWWLLYYSGWYRSRGGTVGVFSSIIQEAYIYIYIPLVYKYKTKTKIIIIKRKGEKNNNNFLLFYFSWRCFYIPPFKLQKKLLYFLFFFNSLWLFVAPACVSHILAFPFPSDMTRSLSLFPPAIFRQCAYTHIMCVSLSYLSVSVM